MRGGVGSEFTRKHRGCLRDATWGLTVDHGGGGIATTEPYGVTELLLIFNSGPEHIRADLGF